MSSKIQFLLGAGCVLAALVSLSIYIARDKESARQAQLAKNLREAGFGGAPDLAQAPRAEFSDLNCDVGVVNPLDRVSRLITVHNAGRKPLKVRLLDQGCSCVAVAIKDEKIFSGQSGVIDLTFTAPLEEKAVDHALLFSTNDPRQKQLTIHVSGSVRRTVWTEPRELDFTGLLPKESRERELRVFSVWDEGCEVTRLHGLPDGVEVARQPLSQEELDLAEARSGELLTMTFPASWTGKMSAPVTFDAVRPGSEEFMRKSVQLHASRLGRIGLSHDLLDVLGRFEIGNIPFGTGRQYTLFLEARGEKRELKLAKVEASPAFVQVSLEPGVNVATSGLHRLKVDIPADAPVGSFAGEDQATISLHFDDPEYPVVTFHPAFHITKD